LCEFRRFVESSATDPLVFKQTFFELCANRDRFAVHLIGKLTPRTNFQAFLDESDFEGESVSLNRFSKTLLQ